jgi:hypothetical protein
MIPAIEIIRKCNQVTSLISKTSMANLTKPSVSFIDTTTLTDLVRKALTEFVQSINTTHGISVNDNCWAINRCQTIIKTGVRTGQTCGKPLVAGKGACTSHSRISTTAVSSLGTTAVSASVKATPAFRKTAHGNYAFENLVISKASKKIYGVELPDGTIGPLSLDDRRKVISWGLQIEEGVITPSLPVSIVENKETVPIVEKKEPPHQKEQEEIVEEVEEEIVEEEIVEEVEEIVEEVEDDSEEIPVA